ncbi:MAG: hypothetical protein AB8I08_17890 [Sandaracinaceae bacterium]
MGLHLLQFRVDAPPHPDVIATALQARLGVEVRAVRTARGVDVRAFSIGGRASLSAEDDVLSLEAGAPANPVFLEQLGAALEDVGCVPLELGSGEPPSRATAPPRRWRDQPWSVRARHGAAGRLAFAAAYLLLEVLVLVTLPLWLAGYGAAHLWRKARPA